MVWAILGWAIFNNTSTFKQIKKELLQIIFLSKKIINDLFIISLKDQYFYLIEI